MKNNDREHYEGKKTWKNYYWFYYKWHMLGALFLIIAIVICTAQCVSRITPDYYVMYYSNVYISDDCLQKISNELEKVSPDFNGDGKVHVQAINCTYPGEDSGIRQSARQQAMLQMQNNDACIWVLDNAGIELYADSDEVDLFAKDKRFSEHGGRAVNTKQISAFKAIDDEHDFYVFCRKDTKSGEIFSSADKVISALLKK